MTGPDLYRIQSVLERVLTGILVTSAVAVFAGTLAMMITMDKGSEGQGGRYFAAAGATFLLGAIDTQVGRNVKRRHPSMLHEPAEVRRYRLRSLALLGGAVLVLFAAAVWLPDPG